MKSITGCVIISILCQALLSAAPDFPEHNFKSTLPTEAIWELKQQFDNTEHHMVMRAYVGSEGERSIILLLGKNNTDEKDLSPFVDRYARKLTEKPQFRIHSNEGGTFGGLPARIIIGEVRLESGIIKHLLIAVAVNAEKVYTCTLSSQRMKVEADDILMEFLYSVRIAKL